MLTVEEALAACLALTAPLPLETVPLRHAHGRMMPGPAVALRDQPPFAASAMDGYAVAGDPVAGEADIGQGGDLEHDGLQRAGQAGQGGGEREGQQLVAVDAVTQRNRAGLVVADGGQHLAERRMHDAPDQPEGGDHDNHHHVIQRHVAAEVQKAEQLAARHILDAVLAASD